jgi:hypothetical protein
MGEHERSRNSGDRNAAFQKKIEQQRSLPSIPDAAKQRASGGESGEEGAHRNGDGIDLDADYKRELPDPEDLIDERGHSREKEHQGEEQGFSAQWNG